jgi:hypothetical protein
MANVFDVEARLADGRPAVGDLEQYVAACRRLGYQHGDLTAQPTQVRDWYDGDEGMNLRALDADHRALSAAASAAEDAARLQNDVMADLTASWTGRGGASARDFLARSCQAAQTASAAVRAAADAAAVLRDGLWRAVDAKVAATQTVDARQEPQRAEWLAAAGTVTGGTGDVAAASELVDREVKPFVNLDVVSEWLTAMRSAATAIDAAYDTAIADLAGLPPAVFELPGEPCPGPVAPTSSSAQTVPAATVSPSPVPASPPAPAPDAWSYPVPPAAGPPADVGPTAPVMGDLGAGTSASGAGLAGFGQQLADLIGDLIGSVSGESPEDVEPTDRDESADESPDDEESDDSEEPEESKEPEEGVAEPAPEQTADEPPPAPPVPVAAPAPEPTPPPPPLPAEAGRTPCEIAADEVPQVGE